jgi:hypothetical protein
MTSVLQDEIVDTVLLRHPQSEGVYPFGSSLSRNPAAAVDEDIALLLPPETGQN